MTIPLWYFAAFRGTSGKDSELYIHRFEHLDPEQLGLSIFSEPILDIIAFFPKYLGFGVESFFLFHAFIVCLFFSFLLSKYSKIYIYFLTVAPVFLIDGITNGMRITLAYHFFLLGMVYRNNILLFTLSFFSHISSVLMIVTAFAQRFSSKGTLYVTILVVSCIFSIYFLYAYFEYLFLVVPRLESKLSQYSELVLATRYSGIADLFVMLGVFLMVGFRNITNFQRLKIILIGLCVCILIYVSIQYSLAFIRVSKLLLVSFIALFSIHIYLSFDKRVSLVLIGVLYSLNYFRQVVSDVGFLPYPG